LISFVRTVPSESDLFFEYDGAHDGGDDHAERVEGRDEHRASLPGHDALHVVCHAGAHYALYAHVVNSSRLLIELYVRRNEVCTYIYRQACS
jgi:hypothetical protein